MHHDKNAAAFAAGTAAAATADEDDDDEAVACDGDYGMIDDEVDRNDDGDDGLAPGTAVAAE